MMHKQLLLIAIFFIVITLFSVLTIGELWVLKTIGLDIVTHLSATYESGSGTQLAFEAFGAIAFVVGQPLILTWLVVWAVMKTAPLLIKSLNAMLMLE